MTPRNQLFIALAAAVGLTLAALLLLRHDTQRAIATAEVAQQEAIERLARKLTSLDSRLTALETAPAPEVPDMGAIEGALRHEIESLKETLTLQEGKLTSLLETPAPAAAPAPTPAPEAPAPAQPNATGEPLAAAMLGGNGYATELAAWDAANPGKQDAHPALRRQAANGIPTEAALHQQFHDIRTALSAGNAPEGSKLVQRLNTHLAGLVSIRKSEALPADYASLAALDSTASLDRLAASVDALPETAQAPFRDWRNAVRDRTAALAERNLLTTGVAQ